MNWHYNGKEYTEKHDRYLWGFVYCVYFENDVGDIYKYYGSKKWKSITKRKFGKREIEAMTDKRKRKWEWQEKENDWMEYTGSCKDTKDYIPIHKEILQFAQTKRELTYLEAKTLFVRGALEDDKCLNANILGKFFRGKLV